MDANLAALIAALADSVAVYAHGVVGHRWFMAQLRSVDMQPTDLSVRLFGPGDMSVRVFGVTWHVVTAVFLACAVALYLTAFGALESRELLRFIALVHAAFIAVGAFYAEKRLDALRKPIPLVFFTAMVVAASFAWIASNSM
ncbi:MAG TPA: hypothetical protein VF066_08765 [Thermoleophilaceae bacterium]